MARTLTEIYTEAKNCRNQYLELNECKNGSKMSIMDAFTWVTSACIWSFETILDVFKVDLVNDLQKRVSGTPAYYANALLKYQHGDSLAMNEDGTSFSYPTVDESKCKITKVSYSEEAEGGFYDKRLVLKVATTGDSGEYERIDSEILRGARAYIKQISFAGTHVTVVSRNGDVLIPRVTVYYNGPVSQDEMYSKIEEALDKFISSVDFNGAIYAQKVIDAIQSVQHVTDVYINPTADEEQGIFVAQYNDDNELIPVEGTNNYEQKINRYFIPNSGFLKQSSGKDLEEDLPKWRDCITLIPEDNEVLY